MQWLKLLVIVMGILILTGLGLLVYGVTQRVSQPDGGDTERAGGDGFGEIAVPLPAGCVIAEARSEGGRLVVRLDGPAEQGCQQVIVVDTESGEVLGRLRGKPVP
jgi:hypothetical protein